MAHVFLSYSRRDTPFVEQLERDLKARGIDTWRDESNIPNGGDWYDSIVEGIDGSYAFVSIVTPAAIESRWVKREALYADEIGMTIIPALPAPLSAPYRIPLYSKEVQPIDLRPDNYASGLAKLVATLKEMDQTPANPPSIPGRPASERAYLDFLLSEAKADLRDALYVNLLASPEKARRQISALAFGLDNNDFGFERLGLAKIHGDNFDGEGETVEDAREAIREMRRALVLGDPGSGKTTTLLQLAVDTAREAQKYSQAKLPVFVPLRQFDGKMSFAAFVQANMHNLQHAYADLLADGKLLLLLDALNEMPRTAGDGRDLVAEVRDYLSDKQDWVISCRVRDYREDLREIGELGKIQIKPLDPPRIREVITRRFADDPATGEALWHDLEEEDERLFDRYYYWWSEVRNRSRRMMHLCRNPYMTNMVCELYARTRSLPENRGALFAAFADELLRREEALCKQTGAAWIAAQYIRSGLAGIAFALGAKTEMSRAEAEAILHQRVPGQDAGLLLRLANAASLIEAGENIRFTHQLLQEYFASEILGIEMDSGRPASDFWQPENWWEANGYEETAIILAGVRNDPEGVARWLAPAQPELAYQVLTQSGVELDLNDLLPETRQALIDGAMIRSGEKNSRKRAEFWRQWTKFIDQRPGVGVKPSPLAPLPEGEGKRGRGLRGEGHLPDIAWCEVPAGPFTMGSDKAHDEQAHNSELPQHEVTLDTFHIGKYPVTNAQFAPFVEGDGYTNRDYWTDAGWQQKEAENWTQPRFWNDKRWNIHGSTGIGGKGVAEAELT